MSLEILTAVVAAGETKTFMVNGRYLELIDAQYPVDVLMQTREGGMVSTLKGAEVSFFSRPSKDFGQVQITSAQAQVVRFFIGDGDAGTRRISSTVQVVDGGKSRTLAGQAFMGANGIAPATGQVARVQLWCAPGSTRRMIVKSYIVGLFGGAAGVNIYRNVVALGGASVVGVSKLDATASMPGSIKVDSAPVSGAVGHELILLQNSASLVRKLEEPVILSAGQGLVMETQSVNINLYGSFEWTEETI